MFPGRAKDSDGTLASATHHAQNPSSDHEPNKNGIVTAMDITHDPRHGFDSYKFADYLKSKADKRIKYLISNRRIWNPSVSGKWRTYNGVNPHDHHIHISVVGDPAKYNDESDWDLSGFNGQPDSRGPVRPVYTNIKLGDEGAEVRRLQNDLGVKVDGVFGDDTDKAVRAFQKKHELVVDGVVGRATWEALEA